MPTEYFQRFPVRTNLPDGFPCVTGLQLQFPSQLRHSTKGTATNLKPSSTIPGAHEALARSPLPFRGAVRPWGAHCTSHRGSESRANR
jgi:hypothetical protein